MPNFEYEIVQCILPNASGWRLRLLENGEEAGGGIFPVEASGSSAESCWWNALSEREREYWLIAADSNSPSAAWQSYQLFCALDQACDAGEAWLLSRSG